MPRLVHAPCRERIHAFRNPPICSDFDCSARLQVRSGACLPLTREVPRRGGERESRQFLLENIRIFRTFNFGSAVSFTRRAFESPPYLSLSGSAAAPPSGGAKPWPCRAARWGRCVLRASAARTHECVPYRAWVHEPKHAQICQCGTRRAWPVPYMARRNHYGAFNAGRLE